MPPDLMCIRTRRNTQGSLNIKTKEMSKLGKLGTKAKEDAITIAKWAKSCKTPEQFANVERFHFQHSWQMNKLEEKDVNYYMGFLTGFIISLGKTKFKTV
jgi:hypothetical protein